MHRRNQKAELLLHAPFGAVRLRIGLRCRSGPNRLAAAVLTGELLSEHGLRIGADGVAGVPLNIPAVPALAGFTDYWQAFILEVGGGRLTGRLVTEILGA